MPGVGMIDCQLVLVLSAEQGYKLLYADYVEIVWGIQRCKRFWEGERSRSEGWRLNVRVTLPQQTDSRMKF